MNFENLGAKPFKREEKPSQETPEQETSSKEKYESSPKEIVLESRDFEREGELLGGYMSDARFVKIRDNGGGVFKYHTRYEDNPEDKAFFISRERAAYLISRFLGFDFVPPTIVKVIGGKEGSLQEFIEDSQVGIKVRNEVIDQYEMDKLKIFDGLILNVDRNGGNWLVKDGKIFAIDNGFSLQLYNFSKHFYINNIPSDIADKLRKFLASEEQKSILHDLLAELLGKEVTGQFMKRVIAFVESINKDYSFDSDKFRSLVR